MIGQALGGGHKKSIVGKKFRCQFGNDANLEMLSLIYSFKLYICQDPRRVRAYTAQNTTKKKRTSRLSRSASIRFHVEVWNGYGRARGVGVVPRRRRSNEAIWPRIPVPRIAYWGRDERKTTAISLVTCIIGRPKNLGLLGQSLLITLAIIYAVAIRLVIRTMYLSRHFLLVYEGCPSRILLPK